MEAIARPASELSGKKEHSSSVREGVSVPTKRSSGLAKGLWSESEHQLFLLGLQHFGKGNWANIAKNYVTTRTCAQVASHAQKYFLQREGSVRRRRKSMHDVETDLVALAEEAKRNDPSASPPAPKDSGSKTDDGSASPRSSSLRAFPVVSAMSDAAPSFASSASVFPLPSVPTPSVGAPSPVFAPSALSSAPVQCIPAPSVPSCVPPAFVAMPGLTTSFAAAAAPVAAFAQTSTSPMFFTPKGARRRAKAFATSKQSSASPPCFSGFMGDANGGSVWPCAPAVQDGPVTAWPAFQTPPMRPDSPEEMRLVCDTPSEASAMSPLTAGIAALQTSCVPLKRHREGSGSGLFGFPDSPPEARKRSRVDGGFLFNMGFVDDDSDARSSKWDPVEGSVFGDESVSSMTSSIDIFNPVAANRAAASSTHSVSTRSPSIATFSTVESSASKESRRSTFEQVPKSVASAPTMPYHGITAKHRRSRPAPPPVPEPQAPSNSMLDFCPQMPEVNFFADQMWGSYATAAPDYGSLRSRT